KFVSMGLFTGRETPVIWRGPMATKMIQQFLGQVDWGDLDYLIIDLPPGTGDVQITLAQSAPLVGAVIVTTPQEVAVGVTLRGLRMFEQVQVPILGIVENMSSFICPHCGKSTEIFRKGGGRPGRSLPGGGAPRSRRRRGRRRREAGADRGRVSGSRDARVPSLSRDRRKARAADQHRERRDIVHKTHPGRSEGRRKGAGDPVDGRPCQPLPLRGASSGLPLRPLR